MAHRSSGGGATYDYSRSLDGGRHEHPQQEYQDRSSVPPVVAAPRDAGFCQLVAPRPLTQRADESQRSRPQRYRHRAAEFGPQSVQAILDGLTRRATRPPRSGRDGFVPPSGHRGSKAADDDEHHHHGAGDEGEHAGSAVIAEQEGDDEAGEDGGESAPRIDEAHRLSADAGRIELGLIGVERERHPIVAQRDQEAEHDHAGGFALLREQEPEYGDADRGPGDLPFALEAVGEDDADQRPDRR